MSTANILPTTSPLPSSPGEETRPSSPQPIASSSAVPKSRDGISTRVLKELRRDVDNKRTDAVSIYACLLTGFTAAISFSVGHLRCGSF